MINTSFFHVRYIQWGDSEEIDWPEDLDYSGAIDITSGGSGGIDIYSLTPNGYIKFSNGLIIQWGSCSMPSTGEYTFTYPIKFPSNVCHVSALVCHVTSWISNSQVFTNSLVYRTTTSAATFKVGSGWTGSRTILAIGY